MGHIRPVGPIGLSLVSAFALAGAAEVNWDAIVRLTDNSSSQVTGYMGQRSIAVDGAGDIHVAWLDQRDVPYQVWYRRYDAGAGTWQEETLLTTQQASCHQPAIACDEAGNVHVAWHIGSWNPLGIGIWAKRYNATTRHWRADTLIDSTSTSQPQQYPSVACVPGTGDAAVAWLGSPDTGMYSQVFLREWRPATGWDSAMQVSSASTNHDQVSVAASANGDLAVVWVGQDFGDGYPQVYCRRRVGAAWQEVEVVSDDPLSLRQYAPSAAFDSAGAVHVVWHGRTMNSSYLQVFHRMRAGGWSGTDNIGGPRPYQQEFASIACDDRGRCHAVWGSTAGGTNRQLVYSQRDTDGVWSSPTILTSLDSGDVSHPSITGDADSGIHVVWYDDHSGNQDVYYLRGVIAGSGAVGETSGRQTGNPLTEATLLRSGPPRSLPGRQLFDACGRPVTGSAPGVYFMRSPSGSAFRRLVIVR